MNNPIKMKVRAGNSVYEVGYVRNGDLMDVLIADRKYRVNVHSINETLHSLLIDGKSIEAVVNHKDNHFTVGFQGYEFDIEFFDPRARRAAADTGKKIAEGIQRIKAPMAGRIVSILVKKGDKVQEGAGLVILEAMKMENKLVSQGTGIVLDVLVSDKDTVESGRDLLIVEMGK
jgi:biotin carboxyl carrier protein